MKTKMKYVLSAVCSPMDPTRRQIFGFICSNSKFFGFMWNSENI